MVTPAHLIEAVSKIQDTILICAPVISQYAALGALKAGRVYCEGKLREIVRVRTAVLKELEEVSDICEAPRADGAFYFLLRVKTEQDPMRLVERLVKEHGVAVIPGTAFGMKAGCYLRVSYGALTESTAHAGLSRLKNGLRQVTAENIG